jgi:two-component system sensor histidine kinase/response regulator
MVQGKGISRLAGLKGEGGDTHKTQGMIMFNDWARVLLAEDNPVSRDIAVEVLCAAGLAVEVAANGQEALEKASKSHFDLILMDIKMPVMDGVDAAKAIRALPAHAKTPIVALTAYTPGQCQCDCESVGMNDFVSKPVQLGELYAVVLKWLTARSPAMEPEAA